MQADLSLGLTNTGLFFTRRSENHSLGIGLVVNLWELKGGVETTNTLYLERFEQTSYTNVSLNAGLLVVACFFITTGQYQPSICYGNG